MTDELIGKIISGRYELLEQLGAGGMATVYRAMDTVEEQEVALKVLPVHLAANDKLRRRFMREAQMVKRLQHPHILPVYDFGEDNNAPYMVMKLVEGGTLDQLIEREESLPLLLIVRVVSRVADALDYAHSAGVIHRDLKPENILFDARGEAYLGDFGIARIAETTSGNLTGTGGFIGTVAYASPEQCRGEELTPASDLYSLGVVLFEMVTGHLPFTGPTPLAIMHKHISEPPPNPLRYRSDLPLEFENILRKALAKLPKVRYQSANAMSTALKQALRSQLGTKPLTDKAPPLGPNPVFNRPTGTYRKPPPMPDELLRDLTPTRPQPPDEMSARLRQEVIRPLDALPPVTDYSEADLRKAAQGEGIPGWVVLALGLIALVLVVVVAVLLL